MDVLATLVHSIEIQTGCAGIAAKQGSWTGQQPLMIGFTGLAQSRTGARGNNKSDKWNNIFKFYLRNYDHQQSFDTL